MKEITVEGFTVVIERTESDWFVATIPELPGLICQVKKEEMVKGEVRRMIGIHLRELASKKMPSHAPANARKGKKDDGENAGKLKK